MNPDTDYALRAETYAVETVGVPVPVTLPSMLASAASVAEVPSGVGHFLDEYRTTRARVTLVDAEPRMLAVASARAAERSLELRVLALTLGTQKPADVFDLVVCPNAAFNYLAATLGAAEAAESLAGLLAPRGRLLLQTLVQWPDGQTDRCGCYAPDAPHETWFTEWTRTDERGTTLTRRRWQRRHGNTIEVRMTRLAGQRSIGTSRITLLLPSIDQISAVFAAVGLGVDQVIRGRARPSEIVLCPNGVPRRPETRGEDDDRT